MGSTMPGVISYEGERPVECFGAEASNLGKTDKLELEANDGTAMHAFAGSPLAQRVHFRIMPFLMR